ncbi:hypothetical protein O6H91_16G013500 [Diphasiastrum complanatum]|uniref:Uncharacterized protein n=1 Tax=Diphasiastrum complanatum TaxID=34168 RepID=A0ACC2BA25_DIPCM|nr:hypothetical protein O6H91_16G013500 [Diphasiastrum complanatum]
MDSSSEEEKAPRTRTGVIVDSVCFNLRLTVCAAGLPHQLPAYTSLTACCSSSLPGQSTACLLHCQATFTEDGKIQMFYQQIKGSDYRCPTKVHLSNKWLPQD